MSRPAASSIAVVALGGISSVTLAFALIDVAGYPVVESTDGVPVMAIAAFCLGFVPLLVSAHTRLIAPGLGLVALLTGVTYLALTTPSAEELYELGG